MDRFADNHHIPSAPRGGWLRGSLLLLALSAGFSACGQPKETSVPVTEPKVPVSPTAPWPADPRLTYTGPFRNVRPEVQYVGDGACVVCHPKICDDYHRHPMGRSLAPVATAEVIERFDALAGNPFVAFGLTCAVTKKPDGVVHSLERKDDKGKPVEQQDLAVQYALGSGTRGRSYLIERDGFLTQSPLSWFAQPKKWAVAPGYEKDAPHFERPISAACLFCHANQTKPVAQTVNRFEKPIFRGFSIGCERCHGPGQLHVDAQSRGNTVANDIVNPGKLEPFLREAVCEQCHLHGAARVPRLGRDTWDYRPGLPLHWFWSVFVQPEEESDQYKAVGHVEQMHASVCFQKSKGRMGCISCHDPHKRPDEKEQVTYYRDRCLKCHSDKGCAEPAAKRKLTGREDDCVRCHMPRFQTSDIAHTAVTDHRILRDPTKPKRGTVATRQPTDAPLLHFHRAWTDASDAPQVSRDLGLMLSGQAAPLLPDDPGTPTGIARGQAAQKLLEQSLTSWPNDLAALEAKGNALYLQGKPQEALTVYQSLLTSAPQWETALERAGTIAMQLKRTNLAATFWERAVKVNPTAWRYRYYLAEALAADQYWKSALHEVRQALALHPTNVDTRMLFITCLLESGDTTQAKAEFDQLRSLHPAKGEQMWKWYLEREKKRQK